MLARAAGEAAVGAEAVERLLAGHERGELLRVERRVLQQVQSGGFCARFAG